MVCVIVPLLLKQNIGVFLESSEVLAVMPHSALTYFYLRGPRRDAPLGSYLLL
jgi:hypothetical protein